MKIRVGTGYDIHRLVPNRRLILAGIEIPSGSGLVGHSDADIVLHSLSDAMLGALALPNIGIFFPNTDTKNKDLDSKNILTFANEKIHDHGYSISNIDIVIVAEAPKLSPHIDHMRQSIADILKISIEQVGIKATTNEGLGEIGQKKAMASIANILLIA